MKMKNLLKKSIIRKSLFLLFLGVVLTSCNEDGLSVENDTVTQKLTSAKTQMEIEDVSEGINDIIENAYLDIENNTALKNNVDKNTQQKFFPDCLTITKVITDNHKKVTLDFGEGCTTRNDNFLSGIIIMEINYNNGDQTVNIDYSFDNFYFNNKKVEGKVYKLRMRENENGNPQAVINRDIKIIWEDGSFISIKGERTREWIEGFDNDFWGDNVFLITGTWTLTKKDGTVRTVTVIEPLKRKTACRFLVSGVVEVQNNDNIFTLNFGNGECDGFAIVKIGDKEYEIQLRKRSLN
jgi:hypothetical protein